LVLGAVALGGIAALDATPLAQTLLSQPLVTSVILGAMWGDLDLAMQVGVVLQILAASTLPVGARTPEDYATGGVIGTGLALLLAHPLPLALEHDACALVGVFAGMLAAIGGVPLLKWQRRLNEGLSRWCEAEVRGGALRALGAAHRAALVLAFAVGVGYCAVSLAVGVWALHPLVSREWLRLAHAWDHAQPLWLGIGLAQLLHAFVQRRLARAALFGIALIAAWLTLMVGGPR
jgi:mannose/fructose/N-acetylgalactosamine-specific phosphotransferase system component IIC